MTTTITGISTAFTAITSTDDGGMNSAYNRNTTYQAIANQAAYLKANAPIVCSYVGNASAYGTSIETITGDGTFKPSTILTTTIASVPDGAILIVDAMTVISCASPGGVQLEKYEGTTITVDTYTVLPVAGTNTDILNHLHGKFVKVGTGLITIRVAIKGGAGVQAYLKSPGNLRVQVLKQF